MVRVAVIGLGKMGLSHYSIVNGHADVDVVAVCDSTRYVLDVLAKYTGATTYTDHLSMLERESIDAVVVSTPSAYHSSIVRECLERGLHVFCEKPFCLDPRESIALAALAREQRLVCQVGYHNRFVAAFAEAKRLLDANAIGRVSHVLAESYGPVVLQPKGGTWRSKKEQGGGATYDYAAHPVDLLTWYFGRPDTVSGTTLNRVFSTETDDEVLSTLHWGSRLHAQLSVSWSDESQRKMTTKLTLWGTNGRINVDRQECQVYLRETVPELPEYDRGWSVRYTTELTEPVDFYVRGEEYSAQLASWITRIHEGAVVGNGDFESAAATDEVLAAIASGSGDTVTIGASQSPGPSPAAPRGITGVAITGAARVVARAHRWWEIVRGRMGKR